MPKIVIKRRVPLSDGHPSFEIGIPYQFKFDRSHVSKEDLPEPIRDILIDYWQKVAELADDTLKREGMDCVNALTDFKKMIEKMKKITPKDVLLIATDLYGFKIEWEDGTPYQIQ